MDFSPPYMDVEQGYLVRAGVSLAAEIRRRHGGNCAGVLEKSGADVLLSRTLKTATLVRAANGPELNALLDAGKVDMRSPQPRWLYRRSRKPAGLARSRRQAPR